MKDRPSELHSERKKKRKTGTRDAAETAIDFAKQDPSATWEEQVAKDPLRITRWEEATESTSEKS